MKATYEYLMIVFGVLLVLSLGAGIFFSILAGLDASLHGNPFAVLGPHMSAAGLWVRHRRPAVPADPPGPGGALPASSSLTPVARRSVKSRPTASAC